MPRLVASRPVTIDQVDYGERWFPFVFRHTDGRLLRYTAYGHDRHFTPCYRCTSTDNGRTWGDRRDNIPRVAWCHSFADGGLFEIDTYGVQDPKQPDVAVHFGAWSRPGDPLDQPCRSFVRVHCPSSEPAPVRSLMQGYPSFPWWPLWNGVFGRDDMSSDEIKLNGLCFTSGLQLADGRLLAIGSGAIRGGGGKTAAWCLQSNDRGQNWNEVGLVARDDTAPEGPNETTLLQLRDGRLLAICRTGGAQLIQCYSSDAGRTWTKPVPVRLDDEPGFQVGRVWPVAKVLSSGALALAFGRPGKHVIVDPTGTGEHWQGRLDLHAWELANQAQAGVPAEQRINNSYDIGIRYWNSGDYLGLVEVAPRQLLVFYDVQSFVEHWNAGPISGIRMVKVTLED